MQLSWGMLSKYRNQLYGISIVWIVMFHLFETCHDKLTFHWISSVVFNNGNIGVDIFLFLSGISLYFSLIKEGQLNAKAIITFYKKRFGKILKVYIIFCVPFLILRDVIMLRNIPKFIKQVLFLDNNVSSFWFIMVIMICYLIYPVLHMLIRNRKVYVTKIAIIIYIVGLVCLRHYCFEKYAMYEILLSRIPIFMIGSLYAEKVYHNVPISISEFSIYAMMVMIKSPIVFIISYIPVVTEAAVVFNRLLMGIVGIGIIFILLLFINLYQGTRIDKLISWIGKFTLEIYVFHIAFRRVLIDGLHLSVTSYRQILIFMIVYIIGSFAGAYVLSVILKKINWGKSK